MSSGKIMIILLTVGLRKQMSLYKAIQYFPKPYERSDINIKVELDLSSYATKEIVKQKKQEQNVMETVYYKMIRYPLLIDM